VILIIDLCNEPNSLSKYEFVDPIAKIVGKCEIVHYSELNEDLINKADRIIMCGNALKDNGHQDNFEQFNWIKTYKKPLLGICGGMQIIGLVHGATLEPQKEIGMTQIIAKDEIFGDSLISAYELHRYTVTLPEGFTSIAENEKGMQAFKKDNLIGIQFHPEVRNHKLIQRFLEK